ncbi:hypothetical protein OIE68_20965 [Nocardia vinacea]|uniref:hypothetical protein n=1 Tax=Nocardia vinacea TaxID=96468 RepID=UPI002E154E4D|nr:hypothetical protein OIE68_20965 [Nocardia vinacea]
MSSPAAAAPPNASKAGSIAVSTISSASSPSRSAEASSPEDLRVQRIGDLVQ